MRSVAFFRFRETGVESVEKETEERCTKAHRPEFFLSQTNLLNTRLCRKTREFPDVGGIHMAAGNSPGKRLCPEQGICGGPELGKRHIGGDSRTAFPPPTGHVLL
jgi:hypothetical protein